MVPTSTYTQEAEVWEPLSAGKLGGQVNPSGAGPAPSPGDLASRGSPRWDLGPEGQAFLSFRSQVNTSSASSSPSLRIRGPLLVLMSSSGAGAFPPRPVLSSGLHLRQLAPQRGVNNPEGGRGLGLTRMDSNARMSSCPTAPRGVRVGRASAGGGCLRLLDHGSDTAQVLTTHWGRLLLGLRGAVFHGSSRGWADAAEGKAMLLAPGWRKAGQRGRWHHCPHQTRALKAGVSHRFRPACYPSSI